MSSPHSRRLFAFVSIAALGTSATVAAYNVPTHQAVTARAFAESVVAGPLLWKALGLGLTPASKRFPGSTGTANTALELMVDGAEFEDDHLRPANHFFNPINGNGLTVAGVSWTPSPDWGLEDRGSIFIQNTSFRDARESYYQSLSSPLALQRDTACGATFETLGHVVHLIQDMSQPQHVRNDQHLDKPVPGLFNPSLFERHADVVYAHYFDLPHQSAYNDGGANSLGTPRGFWQTGPNGSTTGKGLAEFTNRNFVSQGTNFTGSLAAPTPDAHFPLPVSTGVTVNNANDIDSTLSSAYAMDFVSTNVIDTLVPGQRQNPRASTFSLFDDDLSKISKKPRFSYNIYNIEAALAELIPRAIGYSTGMIDYFFRGDIDIAPDELHMGKYVIRNLTSEPMSGTFELYYDAIDGRRHLVPGATWSAMAIPAKDSSTGVPGRSPPIAIRAPKDATTDGVYMLVFRGDLGQELKDSNSYGAVAGRKVKAVPLEGLYVAGLDSSGLAIVVRVDENGTTLVSGPDESGALIKSAGAFDPIGNSAFGQNLGRKPSLVKQVTFPDGPGGIRYRVLAFQGNSVAGVRDTDTWDYTTGVCCWQAQSPDPKIGKFRFSLSAGATSGNVGSLNYERTYVDSGGALQVTSGNVPLPPLPGYSTNRLSLQTGPNPALPSPQMDYKDLLANGPVVSPDGLTVYGLGTASSVESPPGPWDTYTSYPRSQTITSNVISLRISLTATPTVAAVVDETLTSVWSTDWQGTGAPSTDIHYACYTPQELWLRSQVNEVIHLSSDSVVRSHVYVGAFDGAVQSYQISGGWNSHGLQKYSDGYTAHGAECDYDITHFYQSYRDSTIASDIAYQLLDGSFHATAGSTLLDDLRTPPAPGIVAHFHCDPPPWPPGGCLWTDYHPGSAQTYTSTSSPHAQSPSLVFAPYKSAVIYSAISDDYSSRLMFRDIDISGKDFVADASPLGEMFFALSDGSVVIHEPKGGRMPTFVKPRNMITITAALWL